MAIRLNMTRNFQRIYARTRTLAANRKSQGWKKSLTQQINRLDCLSIIFYICLLIAIKKLDDHSCEFFFISIKFDWMNKWRRRRKRKREKNEIIIIIRLCIFIIPYYRIVNVFECVFVCVCFSLRSHLPRFYPLINAIISFAST